MSKTLIVSANKEHCEDALAIIIEYLREINERFDPAAIRDEVERHIANREARIFLALQEATIVGCVQVHPLGLTHRFEVKRMYVRPCARRTGVARTLLRSGEDFARERGAKWLYLDTQREMLPALRFYEAENFEYVPPYHDNPSAQLFLRKALVS